jgi:NusA-like KH domain protein
MNAFESMTKARVVDAFEFEDTIVFLVEHGELGKAIGKGGATIANARQKFGKRVAVFEDAKNPEDFIKKACSPVIVSSMITEDYVKIDAARGQREEIAGKQIRLIKEVTKRKLKVSKIDFAFV